MDALIEKPKLKILFFASDPSDESRLNLGKELQSIRERLKENEFFEIRDHLATKHNDFLKHIMNYKPQIVHFSGHGSDEGELKFEDETGNTKSIPPEALASLFNYAKDFVKCVIVNTCYSEKQAQAIAQFIPIVIGTKSEISDDAAISFSTGFYTALNPDLSIESLENAYHLGNVSIQFSGNIEEHLKPIIKYGTVDLRFTSEVDSAFRNIINPSGYNVKTLIFGLKLMGKKMGLSEEVASNIIDNRIKKLNEYNNNLLEYETNLKAILRDEFPISEASLSALSYLQNGLNLSDEEVKKIKDKILSNPKLDDAFSWYDRGAGQQSLKNFDLAIEYFTNSINKNKEYSAAFAQRGYSYNQKGDFIMSIKDYSQAIDINKNWEIGYDLALAYFDRAFAYIELGTSDPNFLEKGIQDFLKAIELNPTQTAAYYNIGIGYERLKNYKDAVKWYIDALEKGYSNKVACYSGIVKGYTELNDSNKREEWIKKWQKDKEASEISNPYAIIN